MRVFFMAVGILLAFLGVVSASPAVTPTTIEGATPASLGPRRNGHSDHPSSVNGYNAREPANRVPDFVLANDPDSGNDAIIYTAEEIYTAMQQGYEVLQHTRDDPPGQFPQFGNIEYPFFITPLDEVDLAYTRFGRFGDSETLDMYIWPLMWTNSYTGWNQNPGLDRVVFDQNGIYLGVITRRASEASPNGGYRWCPPTNAYARWTAQWIGGNRGWDYTGVPPGGPGGFMPPSRWNIAASQLRIWWNNNQGGMPPVGSGAVVNSSSPPPANLTPPGTPVDPDNPLDFPPMDNSTGTWVTYVPGNITSNLTHELVAKDCKFAHDHGVPGYHQTCQSHWDGGKSVQMRITVSGTGQNTKGWCQGIVDNMKKNCGGNFNLLDGIYSCNTAYPGTVTFSRATDPDDPGFEKYYYGIDMHFYLQWPWEESDADHKCIASAVEQGSCAGADVKSYSGKWCRNTDWRPQPHLLEWSNDMGPA